MGHGGRPRPRGGHAATRRRCRRAVRRHAPAEGRRLPARILQDRRAGGGAGGRARRAPARRAQALHPRGSSPAGARCGRGRRAVAGRGRGGGRTSRRSRPRPGFPGRAHRSLAAGGGRGRRVADVRGSAPQGAGDVLRRERRRACVFPAGGDRAPRGRDGRAERARARPRCRRARAALPDRPHAEGRRVRRRLRPRRRGRAPHGGRVSHRARGEPAADAGRRRDPLRRRRRAPPDARAGSGSARERHRGRRRRARSARRATGRRARPDGRARPRAHSRAARARDAVAPGGAGERAAPVAGTRRAATGSAPDDPRQSRASRLADGPRRRDGDRPRARGSAARRGRSPFGVAPGEPRPPGPVRRRLRAP